MNESWQIAIIAVLLCSLIFASSHAWWWWREYHKKKTAIMPIFGERMAMTMGSLFVVSYCTKWNLETFAIWMMSSYLVLLVLHTMYMTRLFDKKALASSQNRPPKTNMLER